MVKYPNGQKLNKAKKSPNKKPGITTAANRGMGLEKLINAANDYYLMQNIALFTKRPTPINVVKIDYSKGARIIDGYFEKQSTTDYNGVYKDCYFDFEAKSTKLKTSFPLNNIYDHQITHLENVIKHGGKAFFIVEFSSLNEIYVIPASFIINAYQTKERNSIPYPKFKEFGILVPLTLNPILNYIVAVEQLFFK